MDYNPQSTTKVNTRHNALAYACTATQSFNSIEIILIACIALILKGMISP